MQETEGAPQEPEESQQLPKRAMVSLTEAVTWIVEDDSRGDDYLIAQANRLAPQLRRKWCSPSGSPDWLIPHLDLMRRGLTPEMTEADEAKAKADAAHHIWRGTFEDAEAWLVKRGGTAEDAYAEVKSTVERRDAIERAYARCYELLADFCSDGRVELLGVEHKKGSRLPGGEHAPIPNTFFLLPFFHWRGSFTEKRYRKGALSPGSSDHQASLDEIFDGVDARSDYYKVFIKSVDVLKLKRLFDGDDNASADAKRQVGQRPLGRRPTYDWPAFENEAVGLLDENGDVALASDPSWNQAALENQMIRWCQARWNAEPSESLVCTHVTAAIKTFRASRGEADN